MAILADSGTTGPAVTGAAVVQAVPAEVRAIIDEAFKGPSLAQAYAAQEFEGLSPEQKNVVVDSALETIAKNTQLLEAKINGSNNAYYDRLTVSVARSGAPNAEDFFVKHASAGKGGDTGYALRQHFFRCRTSPPSTTQGITVGTLLHLARKLGADFGRCVAALPPEAWSTAELKVSFATIPHRRWLYGTYLIRGEITVLAAPGGAGKTAFANGVVIEIATGRELLGEKVWMSDNRKVLYLNGEDSSTEIKRRLWAFCQQHKLAEQDLVRLYVAGADDTLVQSLSLLCVSDKGASAVNEGGFNVLECSPITVPRFTRTRPSRCVLQRRKYER
jgi:hypothetical protein